MEATTKFYIETASSFSDIILPGQTHGPKVEVEKCHKIFLNHIDLMLTELEALKKFAPSAVHERLEFYKTIREISLK